MKSIVLNNCFTLLESFEFYTTQYRKVIVHSKVSYLIFYYVKAIVHILLFKFSLISLLESHTTHKIKI